ncbi:hypothetical protein [Paraburkholderia sp. GAS42]|uniref:hypothetical protein n=1 Tax=Paraburkholderia sp. GAS42 TaxID=3035135 RepID=UPI003D1FACB6
MARFRSEVGPAILAGVARTIEKVVFLWNYCDELSIKVWERERRFLSGYDFHPFTKGAGKAGLDLHSGTIQCCR